MKFSFSIGRPVEKFSIDQAMIVQPCIRSGYKASPTLDIQLSTQDLQDAFRHSR